MEIWDHFVHKFKKECRINEAKVTEGLYKKKKSYWRAINFFLKIIINKTKWIIWEIECRMDLAIWFINAKTYYKYMTQLHNDGQISLKKTIYSVLSKHNKSVYSFLWMMGSIIDLISGIYQSTIHVKWKNTHLLLSKNTE